MCASANSSWAATWPRRGTRALVRRILPALAAVLTAACATLDEPGAPPVPVSEWDYVTVLPGDEAAPCVERGSIRFIQDGAGVAGIITSFETNCGLPSERTLVLAATPADSIVAGAGTCAYEGRLLGPGPDSVSGRVTCAGRGMGPWHAARVGPPGALVIAPGGRTLAVGGTQEFRASLRDTDGRVLYGRTVSWSASAAGVVALAVEPPQSVVVAALAPGTVNVVGVAEGVRDSVAVVVASASFAQVGVGAQHSCALSPGAAAWCWGNNADGMLGTGDTVDTTSPAPVAGGRSFSAIAGGRWHTCGLDTGGAAWCWGYGGGGWLGDGTLNDHHIPAPVAGGHLFTSLVVGDYHSCGLTAAGAAWCWGWNDGGELGDSTRFQRSLPVAVAGAHAFVELAAGMNVTCGRTAAGQAHCWGANHWGQQGTGSTDSTGTPYPSPVAGGLTFTALAVGRLHACGIAGGAAYCWGGGTYGQTGLGARGVVRVPTPVTGGLTFTAIAATSDHTCALATSGALWCWGSNGLGQLGTASPTESDVPVAVSGGHLFASVSAGEGHTCALDTASVLWCWGLNWYGELGDGTRSNRHEPVRVLGQP